MGRCVEIVQTKFGSEYETQALLEHLFYHENTAPFLAINLMKRFGGVSNPSPSYIKSVECAFRDGMYESKQGVTFGDMK